MATLNRYVVSAEGGKFVETIIPMSPVEEAATLAEWADAKAKADAEKSKPPPTPSDKLTAATGLTVYEIKAALGINV